MHWPRKVPWASPLSYTSEPRKFSSHCSKTNGTVQQTHALMSDIPGLHPTLPLAVWLWPWCFHPLVLRQSILPNHGACDDSYLWGLKDVLYQSVGISSPTFFLNISEVQSMQWLPLCYSLIGSMFFFLWACKIIVHLTFDKIWDVAHRNNSLAKC